MVRDEAPAATRWRQRIAGDRPELGSAISPRFALFGPISFVAAEIHLGRRPAGICDGWLHCNIQVACQTDSYKILMFVK
jgi:hypothetical protein